MGHGHTFWLFIHRYQYEQQKVKEIFHMFQCDIGNKQVDRWMFYTINRHIYLAAIRDTDYDRHGLTEVNRKHDLIFNESISNQTQIKCDTNWFVWI